jgi:hypothetical protein
MNGICALDTLLGHVHGRQRFGCSRQKVMMVRLSQDRKHHGGGNCNSRPEHAVSWLGFRWLGLGLDPMKLLQIDGHQNNMENNYRINVREETVDNEKDVARESCQTQVPDRIHAEPRQHRGRSCKTEQV